MEFALLTESDRLDHAQQTDARYHLAKLIASAFGEPGRIWEEHQSWRSSLTDPSPASDTLSRDDHMALALEIQQKLAKAGVLKGTH